MKTNIRPAILSIFFAAVAALSAQSCEKERDPQKFRTEVTLELVFPEEWENSTWEVLGETSYFTNQNSGYMYDFPAFTGNSGTMTVPRGYYLMGIFVKAEREVEDPAGGTFTETATLFNAEHNQSTVPLYLMGESEKVTLELEIQK